MREEKRIARERDHWDDESQRYHDAQNEFEHIFDDFVRRTIAVIPENSRVVEFGCGSGIVTFKLAPHVEHIVGVDISEKMLEIARRSSEAESYTNVEFRVGDVCKMPDSGGTYDVVLCPYLFDIVERPDIVLSEAHRLLKDSGVMVSITDCKQVQENRHLPSRIAHEVSTSVRDIGRRLGLITRPMRDPRDSELIRLTRQAGFRIAETAIIDLQTENGLFLNLYSSARKF